MTGDMLCSIYSFRIRCRRG